MKTIDIKDVIDIPDEYYSVTQPKLYISDEVKKCLDKQDLSVSKLASNIGMEDPQIIEVTSGANYNIETLLKVLDGLDIEIVLQQKKK
ncbi:hypothetical protein bcgnr5390_11550 [Bacillus luti]|nr:hypothetical protein BC2903_29360 [Bacillus cereus]